MTDREYDAYTEELQRLESQTGLILSGSPTQRVSGEILEELTSVPHTRPMLSANKTKSIEDLIRFARGHAVVISWKMDLSLIHILYPLLMIPSFIPVVKKPYHLFLSDGREEPAYL